MNLYLSSYRIPNRNGLEKLLGKPLHDASVALITNAKDYYSKRARDIKVNDFVNYLENLGLKVDCIDLREFSTADSVRAKLTSFDLVWAMGGNTYMLRYEMKRSGFDKVIAELIDSGVVYGGDSAGALVAGLSIAGIESADDPEFAEKVITEGLSLVPFVFLPHSDNPEFASVTPIFKKAQKDKTIIELKDSQAVIFKGAKQSIVEAQP